LANRFGDVIGEEEGAVGEERGDVTVGEMGDGVESLKTKLLNAPEKSAIANKLTIMTPAIRAFFAELFLFRLPVWGVGVIVTSFLKKGCCLGIWDLKWGLLRLTSYFFAGAQHLAKIPGEIADLPPEIKNQLPRLELLQPKLVSIIVTDIYGKIYEKTVNTNLPTAYNPLAQFYSPSTTILMM
jgi:hypothetical protein